MTSKGGKEADEIGYVSLILSPLEFPRYAPATRPPRKECYDPKGDDGLMSTKSSIYKLLRLWNDASAVKKGKVGKRIGRRVAGKTTGRLLRKLFK